MNDFPERLSALRKKLNITQAEMAKRMGLSMSYVHQLEVGKRTPSDAVETLVRMLEQQAAAGLLDAPVAEPGPMMLREEPVPYRVNPQPVKRLPLLGWAHAGDAAQYEEIPPDWRDWVWADVRDSRAFALKLEGDSMADAYQAGDILIVSPSAEIFSGCLAVIKMADDGFIFRQIEKRPDHLKLIPLNPRWCAEEMPLKQIAWAFPVVAMIRPVMR